MLTVMSPFVYVGSTSLVHNLQEGSPFELCTGLFLFMYLYILWYLSYFVLSRFVWMLSLSFLCLIFILRYVIWCSPKFSAHPINASHYDS
jgi:hypothetical protein